LISIFRIVYELSGEVKPLNHGYCRRNLKADDLAGLSFNQDLSLLTTTAKYPIKKLFRLDINSIQSLPEIERRVMGIRLALNFSPAFHMVWPRWPSQIELESSGGTLRRLLHDLAECCDEKGRTLLYDPQNSSILSGLMVMVNNRVFTGTAINQQDVELHDRDKVSLLYFVSGG
jgi:hypothetical protein